MPHEYKAIALRKTQAYMYAAGWNDAMCANTGHVLDTVDELGFSRYYADLATAFYTEQVVHLISVPDALNEFRNEVDK